MKLRLRRSSLRLRLTQTEVASVGAGERVEEVVLFGAKSSERLVYAIESAGHGLLLQAAFLGSEVRVTVPRAMAVEWANGAGVSLEARQPVGNGGMLTLLVEKDFACLKPRSDEDESDAFPNPATSC